MIGSRRRHVLAGLAVPLLLAVQCLAASAHPHVWIDVVNDILFTPQGLMHGIKQSWTFDESYSVLTLQGLDTDKDRKYSAGELAPFVKEALASLKNWDYFSYVQVNGRNEPFVKLQNASARVEKDKVVLEFELLMAQPVDTGSNDIRFTVYDRSFYNLLSYAEEDPIWLGQYAPDDCGFEISPAKKGDREATVIDDDYVASLGDAVNVGADYAEWARLDCRPR